jgi:hypothetical protein
MESNLYSAPIITRQFSKALFFLLLLTVACDKPEGPDVNPVPGKKELPDGSRKVTIEVDKKYDLNNTKAYGIYDSLAMNATAADKYMAVKNGSGDLVVFIDNKTSKILAVATLDSVGTQLNVNAKTVTAAIHDLIPAYLSLSKSKKADFEATAQSIPEYNALVSIVDQLLTNKEGIYSTNPAYVEQLRKVNRVILAKYSNDNDHKGERFASVEEMPAWLKKGEAPQVINQVYSHVDAIITPIHTGAGRPVITVPIEPRTLFYNDPTAKDITKLPIADGYYNLKLTQKTKRAEDANERELASRVVGLFMGQIFGLIKGQSVAECQAALVGSVISTITSAAFNPPTSWKDGSKLVLDIGAKAIITFGTDDKCQKVFVSGAVLTKIVADKVNVWANLINGALVAKDIAELGPWALALWPSFEFDKDMQVYQSKVIPGCVSFQAIPGSVLKEYKGGEKARPAVEAKIISSYDQIELWDIIFNTKWTVDEGHGTVTSKDTPTNHEGKTANTWTLPTKPGVYTLKAEVKDSKQDQQLIGSPIQFTTKVGCEYDKRESEVVGLWGHVSYEENDCSGSSFSYPLYEFRSDKSIYLLGTYVDGVYNPLPDFLYKLYNHEIYSSNGVGKWSLTCTGSLTFETAGNVYLEMQLNSAMTATICFGGSKFVKHK